VRHRLLTAADVSVVSVLLAVSIAGLLLVRRSPVARRCDIDGSGVRHSFSLPRDTTVAVDGPAGSTLVEVRAYEVRVVRSGCRGQVCVRAGAVTRGGEMLVCAPNRVVVRLAGDGLDGVTR